MSDVLREVLAGITDEPIRFLAETLQSLLLIAGVAWAGRKLLRPRLAARRETVAAALAAADGEERESVRLREEAGAVTARVAPEAAAALAKLKEEAERGRQAFLAQAESDAAQIVVQARQTLEAERSSIVRSASDRLSSLTSQVARQYLDQVLTEQQRRALIQTAITKGLDELTGNAPPRNAGAA